MGKWHFDEEDWLIDPAGEHVGRFHAGRTDAGNDARPTKPHRKRILRALNAHDAFVRLAQGLLGADRDDTWDIDRAWLRNAAKDALAKAKSPA